MTLRVLLIAPHVAGLPRLAWNDELAQIGQMDGVALEACAGELATRGAVAQRLQEWWDVVLWSGHGAPGRLMLADGPVGGDWLAAMLQGTPPGLVVLSACFSGMRDTGLQSLAESISHRGVACVGMWVDVADAAAVTYNVELVRSLARGHVGIAAAHRVAVQQVALQHPHMAGAAFLLPAAGGGYGMVAEELEGVNRRLDRLEMRMDELRRVFEGQGARVR